MKIQEITISEVQILPVRPRDGLVAFACCLLNSQISLNNIAVHVRPDGMDIRLVFPQTILPNGKKVNTFYPITKDAGEKIRHAIQEKYEELVSKMTEGNKHNR
ncbi:hypothetical protein E3J62_07655 [candidate division TA06 bacterium]|uniref:SpoVG family protein n=1 Tax=candidate division TA06 bacterium TaxID=2250710 RepID=A0A523USA1_UNCT6|nr:MAG: hypothetical protein E3J62_07655 [candidate division TA06 bacterium]